MCHYTLNSLQYKHDLCTYRSFDRHFVVGSGTTPAVSSRCACICLFSTVPSGFFPLGAPASLSFLFKAESSSRVCLYRVLLLHSSVGGHRDSFFLLALGNRGAVNMGVQTALGDLAFRSFYVYSEVILWIV